MTAETIQELIEQRRAKLRRLREQGQAFPNRFKPDNSTQELHKAYGDLPNKQLQQKRIIATVAGRIMQKRIMGKASFIIVQDGSGRIQIYARQDALSNYDDFLTWDLGDIIAVTGMMFKTKTAELSIAAQTMEILVKSVRPLPDKYKGLQDIELRYRQRYLDLITNENTSKIFRQRARIINVVRQFLVERDFLEVETPMLQHQPGGAMAKPFKTFYHFLDADMYLRIAPELFLKQLLVGGLERVFEINRNFRNEGVSTHHNPEFTMLEFYQAYRDCEDLMVLTEDLVNTLMTSLYPNQQEIPYQEHVINMMTPFTRLTHMAALLKYNAELTEKILSSEKDLHTYLKQLGAEPRTGWTLGELRNEVFEKTVEAKLIQPTFITHYPAAVSPLARRNDQDPTIADRFELIIAGNEIANGFSELNDYDEQAKVFTAQQAQKEDETMSYDTSYLTALEHGMPPAGGEGIGIDRLVMLLTDQASIRDVLLFPQLRTRT